MTLMVVVLGALALLVALDRLGGGGEEDVAAPATDVAPRDAYMQEAIDLERDRTLVGETDAWTTLLVDAETEWRGVEDRMIRARNRQDALDKLRTIVKNEMTALELDERALRLSAMPPESDADAGNPVQSVAATIAFNHDRPEDVYRLIERLENMPRVLTRISHATIRGPGMKQAMRRIDVEFRLHALVVIGEEN